MKESMILFLRKKIKKNEKVPEMKSQFVFLQGTRKRKCKVLGKVDETRTTMERLQASLLLQSCQHFGIPPKIK